MIEHFEVAYDRGGTVRAVGELDVESAPVLLEQVTELVLEGLTSLRLDLSAVSFVDSTGLRSILTARELVELTLVQPSFAVQRLLAITGLSDVFDRDEGRHRGEEPSELA